MRVTLLIFFVTLFISCDNKIKETNNLVKKPQPDSTEDMFTKQLREHIEKFVPAVNKTLGLPTLIYKPGTVADTSMLDEFRIIVTPGGHTLTYVPDYLFRIYRTKYTSTYTFETYSFHRVNYTIDSVKHICKMQLDHFEANSFHSLVHNNNAFLDHIEYSNYSTTAGGHAIYELLIKHDSEIVEQKRVVKVPHYGFIDVLDYCYNKAKIKRGQEK